MQLPRFSFGIGDRFAHQGRAQLAALVEGVRLGVEVAPVWNKSNREHSIVHSTPPSVRTEADEAVRALGWTGPYFVDADHIGLKTVDGFLDSSDFFTLDVADFINRSADESAIDGFVANHAKYAGRLEVPGIDDPLQITTERITAIATKYLAAAQEAGKIYRHIAAAKGAESFVTEVSMDETERPQTPVDLLFILAALAAEGVPLQTIAPKFTGRFNKGVDYVGDVAQFEREFRDDLAVIAWAVGEFGLPANLKLSVHSGSDKFSIYGAIYHAVHESGAGLHLKTAGTTWLEELIGLASAGGDGLAIAREVYRSAVDRFDELCAPYAAVIDIDRGQLPAADEVDRWPGEQLAAALRHNPRSPIYNPHVRQLLHVGYKVAAQMERRYLDALERHEEIVARNVTENLLERHLKPIFLGV